MFANQRKLNDSHLPKPFSNYPILSHNLSEHIEKDTEGFSSEGQGTGFFIQEQRQQEWRTSIKALQGCKEHFPEALKIEGNECHSLEPDISTGWIPRISFPRPINLRFRNCSLDSLIQAMIRGHHPDARVCYLGPRYENTYFAWSKMKLDFSYRQPKSENIKFSNRVFCGQCPKLPEHCLVFDSFFQSANLDCAVMAGDQEYDLFLRVDSNTKGHLQWYYFTVTNLKKGAEYRFSICNFQKGETLYKRGMRPYISSAQGNYGWSQSGRDVKFQKRLPNCFRNIGMNQEAKKFMLTFTVSTQYSNDTLSIAYCVPYTFTQLKGFISQMEGKYEPRNVLKVSKAWHSLGGLNIPLLTITNDVTHCLKLQKEGKRVQNKNLVLVTGRIHPGQSNGSYVIEGFIRKLLESEALMYSVFIVIPMINPDGVCLGNYRTGVSGKDLNREFIDPDQSVFPEVSGLRKLVRTYKANYGIDFSIFLDFHGHSVKKNVFTYGPEFPISDSRYYQSRILPKLISSRTPLFRYYSCVFRIAQFKESTARAVFFRNFHVPFPFTIEASNGSYFCRESCSYQDFTVSKWISLGRDISDSVSQYLNIIHEIQETRYQKKKEREERISKLREKLKKKKHHQHRKAKSTCEGSNKKDKKEPGNTISSKHKNQISQKLMGILGEIEQKVAEPLGDTSEDAILEGNSDSSGSSQNLSSKDLRQLYAEIKFRKENSPKKRAYCSGRQADSRPKVHCHTEMDTFHFLPSDEQLKQKLNPTKIIMARRNFLKKKSAVQQEACKEAQYSFKETHYSKTAKITVFNFNLTNSGSNSIKNLPSKGEQGIKNRDTLIEEDKTKKFDSTQGFKGNYMSLQKEIIRRQNKKRTLMNTFYNVAKQGRINDIQGTKITQYDEET